MIQEAFFNKKTEVEAGGRARPMGGNQASICINYPGNGFVQRNFRKAIENNEYIGYKTRKFKEHLITPWKDFIEVRAIQVGFNATMVKEAVRHLMRPCRPCHF